jgi:hypothetical protein
VIFLTSFAPDLSGCSRAVVTHGELRFLNQRKPFLQAFAYRIFPLISLLNADCPCPVPRPAPTLIPGH